MLRPRPSLFPAALVAVALASPAGAAAAGATTPTPAPSAVRAAAADKKPSTPKKSKKKKLTTAQRVTQLSRSVNRFKTQQTAAQKQLDAVVKQQALIGTQLSSALSQVTSAVSLASPAGILALLQDPTSGIPQLLNSVVTQATQGITALLASGEWAVAVVTVGDNIASPTVLVSADVPDTGAPVTLSGTVPVILPAGLTNEKVDVKVGAVSLESDGTGGVPVFHAELNHFAVTPAGYTGDVGDAILSGGNAGVNLTQTANGQSTLCTAGSTGCGAPVWSGPNPDDAMLPFWPIDKKLVSWDSQAGVKFDLAKMTSLASGGRLASVTGGSTGPIRVSTQQPRTGTALLQAQISLTIQDQSINPADPLA